MATKIGDWYFEVTADSSPATKALDTITFAAKTASAIIAKELVQAGGEFNSSIQRSTALFTGLTDSVELARDTMREFASLSLDSPIFSPDTLAKTAQSLLAFGVAADDVSEFAQTINLAAEALNTGSAGADRLAYALGQVQSRGYLAGDEVRQLANYSINAYGLVAEAMGKSVAEVRELGAEHKLLAEDVLPILISGLQDTFGDSGQQLINTFGVQVRGLTNLFTALGSAAVQPFIGSFGGGVLTSAIGDVREALRGLVTEGEDGLYELSGALEPLNPLLRDLADEVGNAAERLTGRLVRAASSGDISRLVDFLRQVGGEIRSLASGGADFIGDLGDDVARMLPSAGRLLAVTYDLARDALPLLADGLLAISDILAVLGPEATNVGSTLLSIFGPTLLTALEALVAGLEAVAFVVEQINRGVPVLAAGIATLSGALLVLNTRLAVTAGASGLQALGLGLSGLGVQATAARVALAGMFPTLAAFAASIASVAVPVAAGVAAIATWRTAIAGLQGDLSAATADYSWLDPRKYLVEGPASLGLEIGSWFGGVSEQELKDREQAVNDLNAAYEEGARIVAMLSPGIDNAEDFAAALRAAGVEGLALGASMILFKEQQADQDLLDAAKAAAEASKEFREFGIFGRQAANGLDDLLASAENFAEKDIWRVITSSGRIIDVPAIEEASEFIDVLSTVADDAAASLEALFQADAGSTLDNFLRELPQLAEAVTDAMAEPAGALRDLDVRGALSDARAAALDVIQSLATDYGMSLQEIEDMFNERGLAGVIEALGDITKETTRTVDPLIAKYGQLGASADMIRDAIRRLNDQRTTAIRAQIDQVTAALRDAQQAAEDARKAFDDYFLGGTGGLQGAIDDLVLDIPSIGDAIEEGLLKGGPQGEAMIRQALGQAGEGLGAIFQLGLEQGLSPEEIMDLLGPVYGSIQQEVSGALNRISSLDWTEGFTPQAAAEIQDWLAGILDPAQIGALFSDILGADSAVSGLQAQLDDLNAQLRVDVEFSAEQVQAAIGEIQTEIITEPVITDEAAQAVWKEIQDVFDDDDLRAAIDQARLTRDIVDAAKAAEKQITLDFNSQLVFDPEALESMALLVGSEFADIFKQQLVNTLRGDWNVNDAPAQNQAPSVQDFLERATELGIITPEQANSVTINNDITVQESGSPRATASEIVAASSAAAGSGGRYDPAKYNRMRPL